MNTNIVNILIGLIQRGKITVEQIKNADYKAEVIKIMGA